MTGSARAMRWLPAGRGLLVALLGLSVTPLHAQQLNPQKLEHLQAIATREATATGVTLDQAQCERIDPSAWFEIEGKGYCAKFFFSPARNGSTEAIVYFPGDALGYARGLKVDLSAKWVAPDFHALQSFANDVARVSGLASIYFGRMGLAGSSGYHSLRRTPLEIDFANKALDAIKARYDITRFHFVGQSGGTHVMLGLMARRQDLGCIVLGSGRPFALDKFKMLNNQLKPPYRQFDAEAQIAQIAAKADRRIFVISDPKDIHSPLLTQTRFVEAMRQRGRAIEHIIVTAADADHHNVTPFAMRTIYDCVQGKDTAEILRRHAGAK